MKTILFRVTFIVTLLVITSSTYAQSYIDTTFGEKGYAISFPAVGQSTDNRIGDLIVLPDDKIIAVGTSLVFYSNLPSLAKYNSDGTPDTSFSNKGTDVLHELDDQTLGAFETYRVILLPNNHIKILGTAQTSLPVVLYWSDMSIYGDTIYYTSKRHFFGIGQNPLFSSFILANTGDLYLGGEFKPTGASSVNSFGLLRFKNDLYDTSFGTNGVLKVVPLSGSGGATDGILTANNKILLGGYSTNANGKSGYQLMQFNLDGSLDQSFGFNGYARLQISPESNGQITSLQVTPEGKIYAIGHTSINYQNRICVFKLNSDGSIDYSFSGDGVEAYEASVNYFASRSILQKDGKVILGGYNYTNSILLRINPDGSLDSTFGDHGKVALNGLYGLSGLKLQSNGKIIAGGHGRAPLPFDSTKYGTSYVVVRVMQSNLNDGNTVNVKDEQNVITSFKLEQNYPNPFNPATTINFSLPEASDVTLKVYDVLGKEVASLINERKEAGDHTVNFNAENLSAGMYIYKLTAGSNTISKKMMLVK